MGIVVCVAEEEGPPSGGRLGSFHSRTVNPLQAIDVGAQSSFTKRSLF